MHTLERLAAAVIISMDFAKTGKLIVEIELLPHYSWEKFAPLEVAINEKDKVTGIAYNRRIIFISHGAIVKVHS
jgi:hypothetical protein